MTYLELFKQINDVCYNGIPECSGCFLENVDNCSPLYNRIDELAIEELDEQYSDEVTEGVKTWQNV